MQQKLLEISLRRGQLLADIRQQREALSTHAAPLSRLLAKGDTVAKGVRWLKEHPLAVAGGVAALAATRPRKIWNMGKRSFTLWRGFSAIRRRLIGL